MAATSCSYSAVKQMCEILPVVFGCDGFGLRLRDIQALFLTSKAIRDVILALGAGDLMWRRMYHSLLGCGSGLSAFEKALSLPISASAADDVSLDTFKRAVAQLKHEFGKERIEWPQIWPDAVWREVTNGSGIRRIVKGLATLLIISKQSEAGGPHPAAIDSMLVPLSHKVPTPPPTDGEGGIAHDGTTDDGGGDCSSGRGALLPYLPGIRAAASMNKILTSKLRNFGYILPSKKHPHLKREGKKLNCVFTLIASIPRERGCPFCRNGSIYIVPGGGKPSVNKERAPSLYNQWYDHLSIPLWMMKGASAECKADVDRQAIQASEDAATAAEMDMLDDNDDDDDDDATGEVLPKNIVSAQCERPPGGCTTRTPLVSLCKACQSETRSAQASRRVARQLAGSRSGAVELMTATTDVDASSAYGAPSLSTDAAPTPTERTMAMMADATTRTTTEATPMTTDATTTATDATMMSDVTTITDATPMPENVGASGASRNAKRKTFDPEQR
ncbi:hypothetical protein CYMTET_15838 [Cymbomonas tetramitiformis]|uniref:Uncharacterized protein n=2 Tax=Cymbomonas tetramitiformis TaxID=36881 RepID=A0AAE0L8X9_9CHLO|nr:hypothetical protein CYMTET_15838 [Cymbomonas tetramitiformis]